MIKSLDWENTKMIGQNKEPPHNSLIPYPLSIREFERKWVKIFIH